MEMGLSEVYMIIRDIQNCSSTKAKQHIIKSNASNETFKKILVYAYNDMQYGVKKTTIDKMEFNPDADYLWNNIWSMFEDLAKSNINNDLVLKISNTIGYFSNENVRDLLIRVLLKDLRCNINAKSINKAIPNLIPQHQIMLASKFEGKLKGKVSMSLKMDGIRNSVLIENNSIKHISRQGKVVENLNEINQALKEFNLNGYMLDGELIRKNIDNLSSDDNFRLTTKIVNSKSNNKRGLEFVVFDIVPIEDYYIGKSVIPYKERLELMEELIGEGNEFVRLVEKFGVTDNVEEIYNQLEKVIADNQEGIILNTLDGVYGFGKRSKEILKVKKFEDADVLVTDILEGEGRLEGKLGKIEIQFKYKGKIHTNYIGSGFNDDEREYYWKHKEELIGKVITIKYFELSKNEKGGVGFRFGTWKGSEYIRNDKEGIDDTNV